MTNNNGDTPVDIAPVLSYLKPSLATLYDVDLEQFIYVKTRSGSPPGPWQINIAAMIASDAAELTIELDQQVKVRQVWFDAVHGAQQLRLFNAHYGPSALLGHGYTVGINVAGPRPSVRARSR